METFHRTFVDNVYEAYIQKLPNTFNRNSNKSSKTLKLRFLLKMGPITLKYEFYFAPANLTKTTVSNVEKYLKDNDSGKAYREGKVLLLSNHLKDTTQQSQRLKEHLVERLCQQIKAN